MGRLPQRGGGTQPVLAGSSPLHQGWHMPGYWLLILAKGNEVAAPELIKEGGRPAGGSWQAEWLQLPSVQHIAHVPVQGGGDRWEVGEQELSLSKASCLEGNSVTLPLPALVSSAHGASVPTVGTSQVLPGGSGPRAPARSS